MGIAGSASGGAKPRDLGLDLLRLVAVSLVLGRHLWREPEAAAWKGLFAILDRGGWVGVDLFFVLSGFLVSGLLFAEYRLRGAFSLVRFYTRRGFKIYPPFYVLLATTVAIRLGTGAGVAPRALLADALFFQNYVPGFWMHTWSLAVEEHFYLLLPLLLLLILRLNRASATPFRPILAISACVGVGSLLLRMHNADARPVYAHETHAFPTHLRVDSLFFGVAIAYAYHFHRRRFREALTPWRVALILGGVLCLSPAFVLPLDTTPWVFTAGYSLFYLGSGMLLVGVLLCAIPRTRLVVGLATLGAYSYSIYLWHVPVRFWGIKLAERLWGAPLGFWGLLALYVGGAFATGVLMAKVVEVPALRLRDRWFPSPSGGPLEAHSQPIQPRTHPTTPIAALNLVTSAVENG